jgi:hypothetical protein
LGSDPIVADPIGEVEKDDDVDVEEEEEDDRPCSGMGLPVNVKRVSRNKVLLVIPSLWKCWVG